MIHAYLLKEYKHSKKAFWASLCLLGMFLFHAWPSPVIANNAALAASSAAISEYQVKALYLFYFAKFIDWPNVSFSSKTSPVVIGILGDDNFVIPVEEVIRNKNIQEHPLVVRRIKWSEDLRSCHILFIGNFERKRLAHYANVLQAAPVLTITETEEGFTEKGIMNLFMESGKVQFEVNIPAAEKVQLRISSKLLRMAKTTKGMSPEKR